MKRLHSIALAAALLAALSGCGMEPVGSMPESSVLESSEESSTPENSGPESSMMAVSDEESTLPGEFSPTPISEWTYDAIILANYEPHYIPSVPPRDGSRPFYTIHTDTGWGLMDENGRKFLDCIGSEALRLCTLGHWMNWWPGNSWDWEKHDKLSLEIQEATGHPLCPGHGGGSVELILEPAVGVPQQVFHTTGCGGVYPLEEADTLGDRFFPVHLDALRWEAEDEIPYTDAQSPWNFSDKEGSLLVPGEEFDQVGWFCGETLAPVQKDGKWAYVDGQGNYATEFLYDNTWGSTYFWDQETQTTQEIFPCNAYAMWGGAAVVCREGKWGVLDETGKEKIPCEYEGGAPYPGGAILKKDGQWGLYLLED